MPSKKGKKLTGEERARAMSYDGNMGMNPNVKLKPKPKKK